MIKSQNRFQYVGYVIATFCFNQYHDTSRNVQVNKLLGSRCRMDERDIVI